MTLSRRLRQVRSVVEIEGFHGIAQRMARQAYLRTSAEQLDFPLLPGDVASSGTVRWTVPEPPSPDDRLTVAWVTTPPAAGSGGHTTMFRMIEALEEAGHTCEVYLYDRYRSPVDYHAATIRNNWPQIRATVRNVADGFARADAYVATSWDAAHVLASRCGQPGRRLYFIQDYEPFFYGRGSLYALAEDTYRFGFRNIALGHMVHGCLLEQAGVNSDLLPFGCDTEVYRSEDRADRQGVVFYTRPGVARRGYELGMLALREFHRQYPDHEIHLYGADASDTDVPATHHGRLTPTELNALYNRTIAGIGMSFTNISLVVEEMLAGGTIPVVGDSALARADLSNEYVAWAPPTPAGIASTLGDIVSSPHVGKRATAAAASVRRTWAPAQTGLVRIVEAEVYGNTSSNP